MKRLSDYSYVPDLKDKGWAWMVVLGSMGVNTVTGGLERSKGIMYVVFRDKFDSSAAVTAWIFALVSTIRLCGGPLVGMMLVKVSCRFIIIMGALIAFIACIISMFAPNIGYLFFSFGIVRGVGALFMYVPSIIILSFYFDKYLSFATGIATAGVGLGSIGFPPMIQFLSEMYNFRGLFLNVAAVFLHVIPFALLLRPELVQTRIAINQKMRISSATKKSKTKCLFRVPTIDKDPYVIENKQTPFDSCSNDYDDSGTVTNVLLSNTSKDESLLNKSELQNIESLPTESNFENHESQYREELSNPCRCYDKKLEMNVIPKVEHCENITLSSVKIDNQLQSMRYPTLSFSDGLNSKFHDHKLKVGSGIRLDSVSMQHIDELCLGNLQRYKTEGYIDKVDIGNFHLQSKSLENLTGHCNASTSINNRYNDAIPIIPHNDCLTPEQLAVQKAKDRLCHFYLLKNPVFALFCVSIMLTTMTLHSVITFLPSLMIFRGVSKTDAAMVLSIIGGSDSFSRIVLFGLGFDWVKIKPYRMWVFNANQLLMGVVTVIMLFLTDFKQYAIAGVFLGITSAGMIGPKSVIIADILSAQMVPYSFGILLMMQGLGGLSGSPLSGLLYDIYNNYNIVFYFLGSLCVTAFIIFLIANVQFCKKRESRL